MESDVLNFLAFGYLLASSALWWGVASDIDEPEGIVLARIVSLILALIAIVGAWCYFGNSEYCGSSSANTEELLFVP